MAGAVQERGILYVLLSTSTLLARAPGGSQTWKTLQALLDTDPLFAGATASICRLDLVEGIREVIASCGPGAHMLTRERLPQVGIKGPAGRLLSRLEKGGRLRSDDGLRPPGIVVDLLKQLLPSSQAESLIVFPLLHDGRITGTFWVEGLDPEGCSGERMWMLQVLANCLSLALVASIHEGGEGEGDSILGVALDAQEREREQIALDVHDGPLQMLASAFQHVQAATDSRHQDEEAVRSALVKAGGLLRETMHDLRGLMDRLRPATLDRFGLIASIESEVQELCQGGWQAELMAEAIQLAKDRETTLYRIVHEALTNVKKHAGTCPVYVSLKRDGRGLQVEVRDGGQGFDPVALEQQGKLHGFGLLSMRKRAELLGGRFEVESAPGKGTRIALHIPLRREGD